MKFIAINRLTRTLQTLIITTAFTGATAHAKVFRNSYISFEIADRWDCQLEQTEWVCRTRPGGNDQREAIVILTAKEVGPSDSLPAYEQHLKTPRSIASRTGQPMMSRVEKVDIRQINSHQWVDGMHFSSEIPNYYTRYLATTKDKIAVLVTFSAHKQHYTKYANDFFQTIESLRVIATPGLMGGGAGGGAGIPGSGILGSAMSGGAGMAAGDDLPPEGSGQGAKGTMQNQMMLAIAAVLALLGFFLFAGRGSKKKSKKKKNRQ